MFYFHCRTLQLTQFSILYLFYNISNWPSCIKDYTCCFGENPFEIIVTASRKFQNQNNGKKLSLSHFSFELESRALHLINVRYFSHLLILFLK